MSSPAVASPSEPLNVLLLGELVVVVIVASAFLFYFNRLFGAVFAFFIRLYTWRKHQAYITIGSLQISPLAGRIAFRAVEYHSSNLSIRALHGHVTFRYWWARVRQEGDSQSSNPKRSKLPCRVVLYVEGLEAFVYNRTPAYDEIVERMKKHEREGEKSPPPAQAAQDNTIKLRLRKAFKVAHNETDDLEQLDSNDSSNTADKSSPIPDPITPVEASQPAVDWFREMLPIEMNIVSGSVVLGSDATPTVFIGDFKMAKGLIEITESRSACDKYKMSIGLNFTEVKVLYRTNIDWSGSLLAHGKRIYDELVRQDPEITKRPPSSLSAKAAFIALAKRHKFLLNPTFSRPPRDGLPQDQAWRGLARYRTDSVKASTKSEREYAKVTTLLDTNALDLTYYSDTPGLVPHPSEVDVADETDEIGNVDLSPEYGIDIVIHGGVVQYGPWADRQREALQKTFAPSIFFDSDPRARLRTGDTRVHANLVLTVQFTEETYLRIPTREPSKNWQYDGKPDAELDRRYGWLDVTTGANSSVTYTQQQYATTRGYDSILVLHLDALTIASSVNLQSFVEAQACKLSVTMPTPLRWNAQRDWGIDLTLENPEITLLRDHVTLISDLAKDWSSGVVGDFRHFVPMHYNFRVAMNNYAFHLYINDGNIVDRPQSRDDNAFVDVYGPRMSAYVAVASTRYRPEFSVIPFTLDLTDARLELGLPRWDTQRSFSGREAFEVGKLGSISVSGSYLYYAEPHPDHQETLTLHLAAQKVAFKCLGWVLRRLFCVKDNYFGMFTQFTTTQEYLERFDHDPDSVGDPVEEKYRPGRSDAFAVQVTMDVQDSLILLSDEIYACQSGLCLPVPQLQMALKSVEAFMELSLDLPPTYIAAAPDIAALYATCQPASPSSTETVFIEGATIKANRLFGPQPRATTYLCLWEAVIPKVTALTTPSFVATLQQSVRAVAYTFSDKENAPTSIYVPATPPDVTFFKLTLDAASVMLQVGHSAVSVELPAGVNLDTSSLATLTSLSSLGILLPAVSVNLLTRTNARRRWSSVGSLQSGVSVDIYKAPRDWQDHARKQQAFIRAEDGPSQRIWYMYKDSESPSNHHMDTLYLPRPRVVLDDPAESESETEEDVDSTSSLSPRIRPKAHLRRRSQSRSFKTAKEDLSDSSGESDDFSSVSSSASSDEDEVSDAFDMPSILADHNRRFKHFSKQKSPDKTSPGQLGSSYAAFSTGTLVRIAAEPVAVNVGVSSLATVGLISEAMTRSYDRSSQLLDSTLDSLTDAFSDRNAEHAPLIIDVDLPALEAAVTTTASGAAVCRLDVAMSRLRFRLCRVLSESDDLNTNVTASLGTMRVLVSAKGERPPVSLRTVDSSLPHTDHPLLHLSQMGLDISYQDDQQSKQLHVNGTSTDLRSVTAVLPVALQTVKIWSSELQSLPYQRRRSPVAVLLAKLTRVVQANPEAAPQPSFVSELTYGLHVDDDRNIRRDHAWRIASRLRQILADLPIAEDAQNDETIIITTLARLDWIPDEGNESLTRQQPFVRKAFAMSESVNQAPSRKEAVFVSFDNVMLRHYDFLLGRGRIGSSFVRIGTSSIGVYRTVTGDSAPDQQLRAVVAISSIDGEVQDSIFAVIRHLPAEADKQTAPKPAPTRTHAFLLSHLHLGSANLAVLAGGLRLNVLLNNATMILRHRQRMHARHDDVAFVTVRNEIDLVLDQAGVVLWQPTDDDNPGNKADREVIVANITGFKIVSDIQGSTKMTSVKQRRVIMSLRSVSIDSKPTLRRALDFAQVWQEKHYPHYEPMIDHFRSRLADSPARVPQPSPLPAHLTFDFVVEKAAIAVRTAKRAWIGWRVGRLYASQKGSARDHTFSIRAQPQTVGFYSTADLAKAKDTVELHLPTVAIDGRLTMAQRQANYDLDIHLGHFDCIVKPSALDRLLSMYKTLAPEITQLLRDYSAYAKSLFSSSTAPPPTPREPPRFSLKLGLDGISMGLRADDVATTLLLKALELKGSATNHSAPGQALSWNARVQHFEISLGQIDSDALARPDEVSRKYKSAYMVLDVDVYETPSDGAAPSRLGVSLSRVQTFMHIAALSELSDLVSSWISDVHVLTDQRKPEMVEVREQTSRFLKKMDANDRGTQPEDSWFASRLLTVDIASFGVAVPLGDEVALDIQSEEVNSALLLSVRSISFVNRRNETARFRVQHIGLQFVDRFDRNLNEHFAGEFHASINRMSLPLIDSEAQMSSTADTWTLAAHCSATDFNLGLDPHVVDGVFHLLDLYDRGCDKLNQLEKRYEMELAKNEIVESLTAKYEAQQTVADRPSQRICLRLSFTFESGKVRLYRADGQGVARHTWHDELVLPGISVWVDLTGPKRNAEDGLDPAGSAIINAAIHRSRNTIRPSVLPFFAQLASRFEKRSKSKPTSRPPVTPVVATAETSSSEATLSTLAKSTAGIVRIRLTLRIDQSEIRMTCVPDSQAYVNLRWDSGGFLGSTTFGADEVSTFAGTISGVTTNLSHEYDQLGRSCIEASARDLAFSIVHTPNWNGDQAGISIVMDTRVAAQFRLDLFSAWLTFVSVWVDNAPSLDVPIMASIGDTAPAVPLTERKHVGIAILARFQAIDFDADISVSHARLSICPVVLHTLSNGTRTRVELEIGKTEITAQGDISGTITSSSFTFHTLRKSTRATDDTDPQLLAMELLGGDLRGNLFLADTNIVRFHIEPAKVSLSDDWKDPSAPPLLAFAVQAGKISLVARLLAIPRLLGKIYDILDSVGTQHRIAAQRSETFKNRQVRKKTEASPIAAALVQTMQRTASHTGTDAICDMQFSQSMRFKLAGIDIGIFNESYDDGQYRDFYRFVVGAIGADLERVPRVEAGQDTPFRNLVLSIGFIRWDSSDGRRATAVESRSVTAEEMLDRAAKTGRREVASLPSMDLRMDSNEYADLPPRLLYHFTLVWGRTDGDIAILPNFFDQAWRSLQKLIAGIEQEEVARARRLGVIRPPKSAPQEKDDPMEKGKTDKQADSDLFSDSSLHYEPRDPSTEIEPPIPNLKVLGEGTKDAARLLPKFRQGVRELPKLSHRFVTTSLEQGMDLLLKLYAKQLPDKRPQ